ncbi:MAG: inositol monophosphatase family protein [Rikenellaceae bacterium]
MINYNQICSKVQDTAREAGAFIAQERENFSFERVEFKGVHDMVSYVDKQAEKIIVTKLKQLIPSSLFITEEDTPEAQAATREAKIEGKKYTWIIDPLDGTTNFIHGLPPYCVSIALMEDDELVVGVVYEITLDEMFTAVKGEPAYLNGKQIKVSNTKELDNSLISVGFTYDSDKEVEQMAEDLVFFQKHSHGARRIGSSTANVVYTACGRFDLFFKTNLKPWDVAAGALIAKQAGAIVEDYSGGDNYIFGKQILCCTPHIYNEVKQRIR